MIASLFFRTSQNNPLVIFTLYDTGNLCMFILYTKIIVKSEDILMVNINKFDDTLKLVSIGKNMNRCDDLV